MLGEGLLDSIRSSAGAGGAPVTADFPAAVRSTHSHKPWVLALGGPLNWNHDTLLFDLASMLTTGNNAPGKSMFQFMGLLIGIFSVKVANRYKIAISYRRIELVFDRSHAPLTAIKSKL